MVEKTADKVKFDKEEDIKPLLIAFRKIFDPITKSMKSIAKIPEEIKRIADNISKDIESGVPERTANAVEKIAENPDQLELPGITPKPDENDLVDPMEKLNAQLQLLIDNGIPAKIDEGKIVKLTEKEIKETQKQFIQQEKTEKTIKEQIETVKKSDMTAEEMAKELEILSSNMQKTTDKKQELQTILGDKTPQNLGTQERPGFVKPAFIEEMKSASNEAGIGQLSMVMEQLKGSFMNNIGTPLMSLINMTKKHNKVMEEYGETGEKVDKFSLLKYIAIATLIGLIIKGFAGFFGFDGPKKLTPKEKGEEAEKKALKEGDDKTTAMVKGNIEKNKAIREGFFNVPGLFGIEMDPTVRAGGKDKYIDQQVRKANQKKLQESEQFKNLTGSSDFTKGGTTIVYNDVKTDNSKITKVDASAVGDVSNKENYSNIKD